MRRDPVFCRNRIPADGDIGFHACPEKNDFEKLAHLNKIAFHKKGIELSA